MYETTDISQKSTAMNFAVVQNLVDLKERYSNIYQSCDDDLPMEVWKKISKDLKYEEFSGEKCRKKFNSLYEIFLSKFQQVEEIKTWEYYSIFENYQRKIMILAKETNLDYMIQDLTNICRFCLRKTESLKMMFDDSSAQTINASNLFLEKIEFIFHEFNQKESSDLPNFVCTICYEAIENFYLFKKQCEKSLNFFNGKKAIENTEIKSEFSFNKSNEYELNNYEEIQSTEVAKTESQDSDNEETSEDDSEENKGLENSLFGSKRAKSKKKYVRKTQQCQICGKMVVSLKSHMFTHTGERRYKCQYCEKSFMQPGNLGIHIQSHLNVRKFKCDECGKDFVHRYALKKHMVVHNKEDRRFACSLCDARFTRQRVLRLHEKTHRQERDHVCDVCNKAFLLKQGLKKHYRIHTGEKPYKCTFCDKRFATSYNKKVHTRVHTNEKPFKCSNCELCFSHRSSLRTHQERIHNIFTKKSEFNMDALKT